MATNGQYLNNNATASVSAPAAAMAQERSNSQSPHQFQFRKAVKEDAKLRLALCGPSGSGKTYTLLKLATELGGPVAFIDTERGSARKYADLFEFDVLELSSFDPMVLVRIIDQAAGAGYRVLCIDSLSHFWMGKDGELDRVDRISKAAGNSFAGWKQITPVHNALVDKLISAPMHILASMRSKTDWVLERDEKTGKTIPRKVGLAPVMRDGIEYEFDVFGDMDQENTLVVTKTRCPKLTGAVLQKPGADLAAIVKEWLAVDPPRLDSAGSAAATESAPVSKAAVAPPAPAVNATHAARELRYESDGSGSEAIAAMWKRMCTRRRVNEEFELLRANILGLAGTSGITEYFRILREYGVDRPQEFKNSQTARLCAKRVCEFIAELEAPRSDPAAGDAPKNGSGQRDGGSDAG